MAEYNINVVTAPEHQYFPDGSIKVFLAGGICNCIKWQDMVVDYFKSGEYQTDSKNVYLLNPRRQDWIEEPGASTKQIEWEFDMIERCDIFTMYFAGGESDQPICQYELGRNIERMKQKYPYSWDKRIIITCESSYKRINDVLIQVRLATNDKVKVNTYKGDNESLTLHVKDIEKAIKLIKGC